MSIRVRTALLVLTTLTVAAVLLLRVRPSTADARPTSAAAPPSSTRTMLPDIPGATARPQPRFTAAEEDALISTLRARFGPKLSSALIQMKLIETLVREYRGRGGDWRSALLSLLQRAFPDSYAALSARLDQWLAYESWMQANAGDLQQLDAEDRRANLWAQREALFGKADAEEIWAAELRHESVTRSLAEIDAAPDARLPEKLQRYRASLQEAYGDKAEAVLARHRQEALDRFLDLGSVQRELSALPPAERAAQLRDIRQGLGLDAQALQRWEALDGVRDARWDVGARYMAERGALLKEPPGPAREARLSALRERLFGAESATLAAEEATGFLRFEQPRRWGRN